MAGHKDLIHGQVGTHFFH
uniref:Uncharacterized protein n=1 Tax=Anguilla anguilla TaxID=7936 RepID=A0A0E9QP52_ANGAN